MQVIDVLNKVKIEELAENLIKNHNSNFNNKSNTIKTLEKFYEDINSIKLKNVSSLDDYYDFTIIINETYDDNFFNGENIFDIAERYREKKYDFDKISTQNLDKYFIVDGIHISELKEKKDSLILDFNEYLQLPSSELSKHYVTSYGLDFIPRNIILACNVADLSIQKFGLLNCATEIFWEITFYGLTEEQVQKEASKFTKRIDDVSDNITLDTDEEMENFDTDEEIENFEIDDRDIEFSTKFSRKVCEFSHRITYEFYLEIVKSL